MRLWPALTLMLLALPAGADPAASVDPGRVAVVAEGRDRGKPRPLSVTVGLDRPVPFRLSVIDGPPRLVIDLAGARPLSGPMPGGLRWGPGRQGDARAILTLPGPMAVDSARMDAASATLAVRLVPVKAGDFAPRNDALTVLRDLPAPARTAQARGGRALADGRLRVVLDPGHGGIDSGARAGGIAESALMMGFARELADALRNRGIEVLQTREDDRFVPLERRTSVARAQGADLFVSLHADALPAGEAAGATIYVWDPQSNDRAARQLAALHDRSDLLAGLDLSDADEDVSRALIDLARMGTQPRSDAAARHLVARLGAAGVAMHRIPVRGAAFSVLKSPDIPSLLVELGFLTDAGDRANLFDPAWRVRVAGAIADGIQTWAADEAGAGAGQDAGRNGASESGSGSGVDSGSGAGGR